MKEVLIIFIAALVVGSAINGFNNMSNVTAPPATEQKAPEALQPGEPSIPSSSGSGSGSAQPSAGLVKDLNEASFDTDVLQSHHPVLVDFYATWCGPCRMMAPVVERIAGDFAGRLDVYRVNVDANQSLAAKYNVSSIPTIIIFRDGQRVDSYAGIMPHQTLSMSISRWLNN